MGALNPANLRTANFQFDWTIKPEFSSVKGKGENYIVSVTNIPVINHKGIPTCLRPRPVGSPPFGAQEHYVTYKISALESFRLAENHKKIVEEMPNASARLSAYWLLGTVMHEGSDFFTGASFNKDYVRQLRLKLYREATSSTYYYLGGW